MFTLFVTHQAEDPFIPVLKIERDRFLEYTEPTISSALANLSEQAKECLQSWPCLLMTEGRGDETVRVVEITNISVSRTHVSLSVRTPKGRVVSRNVAIWKGRSALDIAEFEFNRNHISVKDRDLFAVFESEGIPFDPWVRDPFKPKQLPKVARADLLATRAGIEALGHAEIDDLLLEIGVSGLSAGKELGGKKARATAIVQFAIEHPDAVTSENGLLSIFLLQRFVPEPHVQSSAQTRGNNGPDRLQSDALGKRKPNRVFVVHGRNGAARTEVVEFLRSLGLEPIVLHEQANMGRHLLTKFIDEAALVTFAVVLMTDDDVGGVTGGELSPRARQNVILELGYFIARLGPANVCPLVSPGLEAPSDFDGVAYVRMDDSTSWKAELLRELRAAEMPVNDLAM